MTTVDTPVTLELNDIQNGALHPRPSPYVGAYIVLRIEDRRAGRELLRRLIPFLADATSPMEPSHQAWITAALSYQGLKALGVPQDTLDSFPLPFQQGMAARAAELGDVGESAPENWEKPFGTTDVHVGLSALSPDAAGLERVLAPAREAIEELSGVTALWSLDCYALPTETEAFGFRDGISHPAIEGSGIPGSNPQEQPSRRASSYWAMRMSGMRCPRCRGPRCWVRTAPTSFSASCTNALRRFASI